MFKFVTETKLSLLLFVINFYSFLHFDLNPILKIFNKFSHSSDPIPFTCFFHYHPFVFLRFMELGNVLYLNIFCFLKNFSVLGFKSFLFFSFLYIHV